MTQLETIKHKLSTAYIREKVERHYWKVFLANYIQSLHYEKFEISFGKMPTAYKELSELKTPIDKLRESSTLKQKESFQLVEEILTTRESGGQTILKKAVFETENALLHFIGKTKQAKQAKENYESIRTNLPELKEWILTQMEILIEIEESSNWDDIIKVCRYFLDAHIPDKYFVRELKIQVHSKFIEENEHYLKKILNAILPEDKINKEERKFAPRFQCKFSEELIRLKFLDNSLKEKYKIPFTDFSIPLSEFVPLNFQNCNILILENKTNFHLLQGDFTFPNTIVIFGSGFGALNYKDKQSVNTVKPIYWITNNRLFYWGDLDSAGLEILSKFRHTYPHAVSVFMDKQTYSTFEKFAHTIDPSKEDNPDKLSVCEYELYTYLKQNNLRLEQERLTHEYIKTGLEKMLT